MASAKLYLLFIMVVKLNAEMFPSYSQYDDERPPHKIILRSKRQQCVCVSVTFPNTVAEFDPASSSFQCSCDPSAASSYIQTPLQQQYQQQQELQRELQQVQSPRSQSTSCGCELSPQYTSTSSPTTAWSAVSFGTTQNPFAFLSTPSSYGYGGGNGEQGNNNIQPMFDCQCVTVPQNDIINNLPTQQQNIPQNIQQHPSYSQLMQYPQFLPTTTSTTTTTTTPQPFTTTSTTTRSPITQNQNRPHCKCVEIQILLSSEPQIQCDCNGNGNNNGNNNNNNNGNSNGNGQETRLPSFPQYTPPTTQPQSYTQTTTILPPHATTTRSQIFTPPTRPRTTTEPDALPCVMIQIRTGQKVCACQENYKQCTENVCCNTGKYRNLRTNDDPQPSAGAATVDLLVDLLQKVRETFV